MKRIAIGLDQSFTDTGISLYDGKSFKYVSHECFKGCSTKSQKRQRMRERLTNIILRLKDKYSLEVTLEAIRLFSGKNPHISTKYILATASLVSCIVDVCNEYSIPVYWIGTRSWKKFALGSSKPSGRRIKGVDINKVDAIIFAKEHGILEDITTEVKSGKNKGKKKYNDNMADSAGIAYCGYYRKRLGDLMKNIEDF